MLDAIMPMTHSRPEALKIGMLRWVFKPSQEDPRNLKRILEQITSASVAILFLPHSSSIILQSKQRLNQIQTSIKSTNDMAEGTSTVGQINWTEIPVEDLDRAKKFYENVFGWECDAWKPTSSETGEPIAGPEMILFSKGRTHGCFLKVEPENHLSPALHPNNVNKKRRAVTVTIAVDSVDELLKTVGTAGGEIYMPAYNIPNDMGRVAHILDSEKNIMGVWSQK